MIYLARPFRLHGLHVALGVVALGLGGLIARASPVAAVVALGAASLVVATMAEPVVGVGAALLLGPLRAWLEIVMPGLAPHVGQLVLFFALGSWIASGMVQRRMLLPVPGVFVSLIIFLLAGLVSLWRPVDVWDGALEFLKWAQILLVAVVVYDGVQQGRRRVYLAIGGVGASALFQAVVGLWQFGLRGDGVEQFAINDRFYRAYGTFQQPNPYAGHLGLVAALFLGVAVVVLVDGWRPGARRRTVILAAAFAVPACLMVGGLLASWSRGAWMGFGVAGLSLLALLPRRALVGLLLVMAMIAVGGGLFLTGRLPDAIVSRLTGFTAYVRFEDVRGVGITDENFAVIERMAHWQAGLSMWRSRFWRGIGLGSYEAAYADHALINWPLPLGHAHNLYLNMLAEVGLIGLLAYLGWLGTMIGASVWATRHTQGWGRGLATGLVGAWTHLTTHSLVDNLLVNNVHMHIGVLVALTAWAVAVARTAKRAGSVGGTDVLPEHPHLA